MSRIELYCQGVLEFQVTVGDRQLRVGRGERCDIRVNDKTVSRVHALIIPSADGCLIRDLSMNGTWINDERVEGDYPLGFGDRIRLGERFTLILRSDNPSIYIEGALKTDMMEKPIL